MNLSYHASTPSTDRNFGYSMNYPISLETISTTDTTSLSSSKSTQRIPPSPNVNLKKPFSPAMRYVQAPILKQQHSGNISQRRKRIEDYFMQREKMLRKLETDHAHFGDTMKKLENEEQYYSDEDAEEDIREVMKKTKAFTLWSLSEGTSTLFKKLPKAVFQLSTKEKETPEKQETFKSPAELKSPNGQLLKLNVDSQTPEKSVEQKLVDEVTKSITQTKEVPETPKKTEIQSPEDSSDESTPEVTPEKKDEYEILSTPKGDKDPRRGTKLDPRLLELDIPEFPNGRDMRTENIISGIPMMDGVDGTERKYTTSPSGRTVDTIFHPKTKRPSRIFNFMKRSSITNDSLYTYITT